MLKTFASIATYYVIAPEWCSALSHRCPSVGWTQASQSSERETVCCSVWAEFPPHHGDKESYIWSAILARSSIISLSSQCKPSHRRFPRNLNHSTWQRRTSFQQVNTKAQHCLWKNMFFPPGRIPKGKLCPSKPPWGPTAQQWLPQGCVSVCVYKH